MIRVATQDDIHHLKQICTYYDFKSRRDWDELLQKGVSYVIGDTDILGFLSGYPHHWNNTMELTHIFIKPEYRLRGHAAQLLLHFIGEVSKWNFRTIIAEVPEENELFYKKHHFRKCGTCDRYYDNKGSIACFYSYDFKPNN